MVFPRFSAFRCYLATAPVVLFSSPPVLTMAAPAPSIAGMFLSLLQMASSQWRTMYAHTIHRLAAQFTQAFAPSIGPQIFLCVCSHSRSLGHPSSFSKDMEALAFQGVAPAQDDLPLYPHLHANRVYYRRYVLQSPQHTCHSFGLQRWSFLIRIGPRQ